MELLSTNNQFIIGLVSFIIIGFITQIFCEKPTELLHHYNANNWNSTKLHFETQVPFMRTTTVSTGRHVGLYSRIGNGSIYFPYGHTSTRKPFYPTISHMTRMQTDLHSAIRNASRDFVYLGVHTSTPKSFHTIGTLKTPNRLYDPESVRVRYPPTEQPPAADDDATLQLFFESLLAKDARNLAIYVRINYQGKTTSISQIHGAPLPLLTVDPQVYKIPTIKKLKALLNNYEVDVNAKEIISALEKTEENDFLDQIIQTEVMQYTKQFLLRQGKVSTATDFKQFLQELWFRMYSRSRGIIGSSAFEHVFVAETKDDTVMGFHNWIYYSEVETKQLVKYFGYTKKVDFGKGSVIKYRMKYNNIEKPAASMFIGTSPEFEMALYTVCFLFKASQPCPIILGGYHVIIRTYPFHYKGKTMIGSAYPNI